MSTVNDHLSPHDTTPRARAVLVTVPPGIALMTLNWFSIARDHGSGHGGSVHARAEPSAHAARTQAVSISASRRPMRTQAGMVGTDTMRGMTVLSAMRRLFTPLTRSCGSTTERPSLPMRQAPDAW